MGIVGRFKDIMASNIHALFNREDKHPERTVQKYLDQMYRDLRQVHVEKETGRTEYERAARAYDENVAEQEKYKRYVRKAEEDGNISDANRYRRMLDKVEADGKPIEQKYLLAKDTMDKLSQMDGKLEDDIKTLEAKLNELKGKLDEAERLKAANGQVRSATPNVDGILSRANDKADRAIDRLNAMNELNGGPMQSDDDDLRSLSEKYENMEVSESATESFDDLALEAGVPAFQDVTEPDLGEAQESSSEDTTEVLKSSGESQQIDLFSSDDDSTDNV